jgi:hypothetical protein
MKVIEVVLMIIIIIAIGKKKILSMMKIII